MKFAWSVLACLILPIPPAAAQEHLIPDAGAMVDQDSYHQKVRHVFESAFERGVALRAVVIPSFRKEYAVGVREADGTAEAFVLEPSSMIWNTEIVALRERGQIRAFDRDGKPIPPEADKSFQELKGRTPADYRQIEAKRRARAIPADLAAGLKQAWERMLLDVRHPAEPEMGHDGVTYHFSMFVPGRGEVSGHVWSPDEGTKTARFAELAQALAGYAREEVPLEAVRAKLAKLKSP